MVKELAWLLEVGVTESSSMEGRVYALVLFRVGLKCFSVMADGKKYVEGVESREDCVGRGTRRRRCASVCETTCLARRLTKLPLKFGHLLLLYSATCNGYNSGSNPISQSLGGQDVRQQYQRLWLRFLGLILLPI